jgi:hypothetical protein
VPELDDPQVTLMHAAVSQADSQCTGSPYGDLQQAAPRWADSQWADSQWAASWQVDFRLQQASGVIIQSKSIPMRSTSAPDSFTPTFLNSLVM